jgi:hypothetical protein
MPKPLPQSPTAPAPVRLLLVLALPLVALALYLDGQDHDADLLQFEQRESPARALAVVLPARLAGLERAGQVRVFDKENLYEYINGHAEYFIGAGFRRLAVAEYGAAADGQPRLVVNLYDLARPLNAFGALVDEAGQQESVELGSLGFGSDQGVSFIHGPYYVQVSRFDPAVDALAAGRELAQTLASASPAADLAFRFPDLGTPTATRFVREYYRGMEFLNRVLERDFRRGEQELQAFLISAPNTEIRRVEEQLKQFLAGDRIPFQAEKRSGLRLVTVRDPYEGDWFFVPLEERLLGVYAPLDDALASALATFAEAEPTEVEAR